MRIFLDANILVSVLNHEQPLFSYTSRILSLTDNRKFSVYTSPICLAIAFYFASKKSGDIIAKNKIALLSQKINIADAVKSDVIKAVENKSVHDFEDGLEYYSALRANCKCIITENLDDFYFSKIEVLDSKSFMMKYGMK